MKRRPKRTTKRSKPRATTALVLVPRASLTRATRATKHKHKKRRHTMAMPAGLARYWAGRRRKRKPSRRRASRRTYARARHHARRAAPHVGSVVRALVPSVGEAVQLGTAALYGTLEKNAATDDKHFLRSVPTPMTVLGRSGNLGVFAWGLAALLRQPLLRHAALGVVDIAAYQLTRRPKAFGTDGDKDVEFKLAGRNRTSDRSARLVQRYLDDREDDPDAGGEGED